MQQEAKSLVLSIPGSYVYPTSLRALFVTASASISRPRRSSSFTQLLCCYDMNEISWYYSISTQRKFHRLPVLSLFCCLRSLLCYVRCTTLYISCQSFIRYFSDICNPFDKWKQAVDVVGLYLDHACGPRREWAVLTVSKTVLSGHLVCI